MDTQSLAQEGADISAPMTSACYGGQTQKNRSQEHRWETPEEEVSERKGSESHDLPYLELLHIFSCSQGLNRVMM